MVKYEYKSKHNIANIPKDVINTDASYNEVLIEPHVYLIKTKDQ